MKDKRSWDCKNVLTLQGGGEVTKKVNDLQLGNTWAAEKIKTKRDQSKTLNILMVLGGLVGCDSCRNAGDENQGATSQPSHIGGWDEGCVSCLPMCPWSDSAAQNAAVCHRPGCSITVKCSGTGGGSIAACVTPSSAEKHSV